MGDTQQQQQNMYECSVHKITHQGQKRELFQETLFHALLDSTMERAYQLYTHVKHGCDCPENYKAFDIILATTAELPSKPHPINDASTK